MKTPTPLLFIIIIFIFTIPLSVAQPAFCTDTISVFLNEEGVTYISGERISLDTLNYDSVIFSQNEFRCIHLGLNEVGTQFYKNGEIVDSCKGIVNIRDILRPFGFHPPFLEFYIEEEQTLNLTSELILEYAFDNCTLVSTDITPFSLDTSNLGDNQVRIRLIDQSGNTRISYINIHLQLVDCDSSTFACKSSITSNIVMGEKEITYMDLIAPNLENCSFPHSISWLDVQGNPISVPGNVLTTDHLNDTLYAVLMRADNNERCTTEVRVANCKPATEFTVQWPADFTVQFSCLDDTLPDLSFLSNAIFMDRFMLDSSHFRVGLEGICHKTGGFIFYDYEDQVINQGALLKVIRRWNVKDWSTGYSFYRLQLITIEPGPVKFQTPNCKAETDLDVGGSEYKTVSPDLVLENESIFICDQLELSFLNKHLEAFDFPENRVFRDFPDSFFYVVTTAVLSQMQCTTKVNVLINPSRECWERFYVCDLLPNGQNFNECDSGYTIQDNIEWPRDVELEICGSVEKNVNPESLLCRPNVSAADAYPIVLIYGCSPLHLELTYTDEYPDSASATFPQRIIRSWEVAVDELDRQTSFNSWSYEQTIMVTEANECRNRFSVYTGAGIPVENVSLGSGYITDQQGEIDLTSFTADSITPAYTAQMDENSVSTFDLNLMQQVLNNEIHLNPAQRIAADVNFDGKIDSQDILLLEDYLLKKQSLEKEWVFVNLDFPLSQMEDLHSVPDQTENVAFTKDRIAYQYMAIRVGDIDLSVFAGPEDSVEVLRLTFEDQVIDKDGMVNVPIFTKERIFMITMQFSLHFDPDKLEFRGIADPRDHNIDSSNYNLLNDSTLLFSWNFNGVIHPGNPFVLLQFKAKESGNLCDMLSLDSIPLKDETLYFTSLGEETIGTLQLECEYMVNSNIHPQLGSVVIYPNPANNHLSLHLPLGLNGKDVSYSIMDLLGHIVKEADSLNKNTIYLQNVPTGIYWLEIRMDGFLPVYKKFSVQM